MNATPAPQSGGPLYAAKQRIYERIRLRQALGRLMMVGYDEPQAQLPGQLCLAHVGNAAIDRHHQLNPLCQRLYGAAVKP